MCCVNFFRFVKLHGFLIITRIREAERERERERERKREREMNIINISKKNLPHKNGFQKCWNTVTLQKVTFFVMVPLLPHWTFNPFVIFPFFILLLVFHIFIVIYWIYHGMPTSLIFKHHKSHRQNSNLLKTWFLFLASKKGRQFS